jgi:hypothetical protein
MGSLVSELLQIHDGNYVVRAVVQVGSVTIATGMAAATEIDQAEDQARMRALAVLGIHLPAHEAQAQLLVSEAETKPTPASLSPGIPDSIPRDRQKEAVTSQTFFDEHSADWPSEEVKSSELSSTSQLLDPKSTLPDTPKHRSKNGKVSTQSSRAIPQNDILPQPIDLSDIIAQTSVELKRLNWSDVQGRSYLQRTYGKRSRQQLTDEELLEFLYYLQSQPSDDEPSF